jgi:hypothetical protein
MEQWVSFEAVPDKSGVYRLEMANYRATIRYHCAPATPGQVHIVDDHEYQRGWVQNLSLGGIGLLLSRAIAPGTSLEITLKSADQVRTFNLQARVVHSTVQPSGDWLIGCQFNERLTEDDLDCLLY